MRTSTWMQWLLVTGLLLGLGCSGFSSQCRTDGDCPAGSYCNPSAEACFVRSGGAALPVLQSVTQGPGAGVVTVKGMAQPTWTVNIFTNSNCTGTPAGSGTADATTGQFSIPTTAPSTGTVYANAEGTTGGSTCTQGLAY